VLSERRALELIGGTGLLSLLAEHTGVEAVIVPPEDWVDPVGDIAVEDERPWQPTGPTSGTHLREQNSGQ
jgi:hypothetical protein